MIPSDSISSDDVSSVSENQLEKLDDNVMQNIIDLTNDDLSEEEEEDDDDFPSVSSTSKIHTDDDDNDSDIIDVWQATTLTDENNINCHDNDSDVEIVEKGTIEVPFVQINNINAIRCKVEDADDADVCYIGTLKSAYQSHIRRHCPRCIFPDEAVDMVRVNNSSANASDVVVAMQVRQYCQHCYCLVCDVKVNECVDWSSHCFASDIGPNRHYWLKQRSTFDKIKIGCSDLDLVTS